MRRNVVDDDEIVCRHILTFAESEQKDGKKFHQRCSNGTAEHERDQVHYIRILPAIKRLLGEHKFDAKYRSSKTDPQS